MGLFKDDKKKIDPEPIMKTDKQNAPVYDTQSKTLIGRTAHIDGEIKADEEIVIEGKITGKIESKKAIIVGSQGIINADLQAPLIKVGGKVIGNIYSTSKVEVEGTAHIEGNISAPRLSISETAYFKGNVDMSSKSDKVVKETETQKK